MNFIGHAEVARWTRREPGFVFGAMLPDFAHMAGARRLTVEDPLIAEGMAHHHATDAAFHGAPTFVALCAAGVEALTCAGVRRGTARALAHVGTELLLDGLLLEDSALASAYVESIGWATEARLDAGLSLHDDDRVRLGALAHRLTAWGAPHDYRSPDFVADRLELILRPRPRLAVVETERHALAPFAHAHAPRVAAQVDALLAEVEARLDAAR